MTRPLFVLLLAASARSCVTYEFDHEFWLNTNGSGSFIVTAPPWVWNSVKNVGDSRNIETTVTATAIADLFRNAAFSSVRVKTATRGGQPYITVAASFSDVNALIGTKAFPDLAISLRSNGERLRLFGVWRRPPNAGTAQGDDTGRMAVRFHIPSEIFDHQNAASGVERGNILSWTQDLSAGIAGTPLDFGATLGTTSVLRATLGLFALAGAAGVGLVGFVLRFFRRKGRGTTPENRNGPGSPIRPSGESDFLNYDPTSGR